MPIYGYRCGNCGHQFEVLQRISDEPMKVCPKCQGKLTKMLYPAGVIFKGSGYYTTDYKSSSHSGSSSNGSSSSPPSTDSKSESGSESKSENKGSSKEEKSA